MKKSLINEINRVKTLMGVNLLTESIPGALSDLVQRLGKTEDEIADMVGAGARKAGVPSSVLDDIIAVIDDPSLYDILEPTTKRAMFKIFSEIDEIAGDLYANLLTDFGVNSTDIVQTLVSKMKKFIDEAETAGTELTTDVAYEKAVKELIGEDGPEEIIDLFKKQNYQEVTNALGNKVNKFSKLSDVQLDEKLVQFKKKANGADWTPSEDDFELVEELIKRKKLTTRAWQEMLSSNVPGFNEVIRLHDVYKLGVGNGSIKSELSFTDWIIDTTSKRLPTWYSKNGALFLNRFIRPYKIVFGAIESTAKQKTGAWVTLVTHIGLYFGIIQALLRTGTALANTATQYFENLTGIQKTELKSRWNDYWLQDEPQLKIGDNTVSIYNSVDLENNKQFKTAPPLMEVMDSDAGTVMIGGNQKISIQGKLYDVVRFVLSKTSLGIVEGSSIFPDYISPISTNTATTSQTTTNTYTNDITSFKAFLNSQGINSDRAYYDEVTGIFWTSEGGADYEFDSTTNTFK